MNIPVLEEKQILENLNKQKNPFFEDYFAFYSSWYGGIIQNPRMMLIPIDDHMVHRGDGVFEGIKAIGRAVYQFEEHLQRLLSSAKRIELEPQLSLDEMREIILETLRVANKEEAAIRVYLSRGPGNFSVNPYDSVGSQFYVAISRLVFPSEKKYEQGVKIAKSTIPPKDSWMAQIKSCNYIHNVLMKKEAVDQHVDFTISVNSQGHITEGATENIMIVDKNGIIVHPEFDSILKGTTMLRACELAHENGMKYETRPILLEELQTAQEVMMCGTTLDVLPVVEFEGYKFGNGRPGPIAATLRKWLLEDMRVGPRRTHF